MPHPQYHLHHGAHFYSLHHGLFAQSASMSQTFSRPPPSIPGVALSSPRPQVLLVTLDRPKQLNAVRRETHLQLERLWAWYDAEPRLRCAVLTGRGRAFCAGADLKEWHEKNQDGQPSGMPRGDGRRQGQHQQQQQQQQQTTQPDAATPSRWNDGGFGGLSNRGGKKPVIAAVNGLCYGGGFEMVVNADMVLATPSARFGLPEVTRGVVAIAGALPRLTRILGRPRAAEMALLGRTDYTAAQMLAWGVVNKVVEEGQDVVEEALRWAGEVAGNSPDAVIVSRAGLMGGWEPLDPRESTKRVDGGIYRELDGGENMKEGVLSFVERRKAVWKDSKL